MDIRVGRKVTINDPASILHGKTGTVQSFLFTQVEVLLDDGLRLSANAKYLDLQYAPVDSLRSGTIVKLRNGKYYICLERNKELYLINLNETIKASELKYTVNLDVNKNYYPGCEEHDITAIWMPSEQSNDIYAKALSANNNWKPNKSDSELLWERPFDPIYVCGVTHDQGFNKKKVYVFAAPHQLDDGTKVVVDTSNGKQFATVKWCKYVTTAKEYDGFVKEHDITIPLKRVVETRKPLEWE